MFKKILPNGIFRGIAVLQIPFLMVVLLMMALHALPAAACTEIGSGIDEKIVSQRMPESSREYLPVQMPLFTVAAVHCIRLDELFDCLAGADLVDSGSCWYFKYIPLQNFILRINSSSITGRAGPYFCKYFS